MATAKLVLRKDKKPLKDGSFPIAIRITQNRKVRYIFFKKYALEKHWDSNKGRLKNGHPNYNRLNKILENKLREATDLIYEDEINEENKSASELKEKIKRSGKQLSFFELAELRFQEYKERGTFSVVQPEETRVKNIKEFNKSDDLSFRQITVSYIEKFAHYSKTVLKHENRTTTNHLIFIRTLFNRAIKEGIVDKKYYPFGKEKVQIKISSGNKIGLTREEVEKIESLDLEPNSTIWHSRNVWLFSFYFAGIRISDVVEMKWSDFKDNRVYYIMNKNEKPVSLKIPEKAGKILDLYRGYENKGYLFHYLNNANLNDPRDVFRKSRNAARLMNKYLKRIADQANIDKKLSNHIARHTFGNIAGDKIHPLMLQKLYRHFDLKTTLNYQANFIHKDADDALDSVVDF
ncbi:site-specific integrase [Fulvivirga lutea]|uniref:Site-specific integrase n=1 Tax=Fulvivirga lutea TaxID=2810512 RepID=A0A974WHL7_9BACT|nr:site-specific integrase [Fulvivirga lutea]QSE98698.1 site-specific integrase [Fulvivirga lutea]